MTRDNVKNSLMAIKATQKQSCEEEDVAKAFQLGLTLGLEEKHNEMDKDAISRQAVIDTIDKWVKNMHVLTALSANEVTPLFESVHELSQVTPQLKMGRWAILKDEYGDITEAVCSCCDKNGNHKWAYCPNCGAKMKGVE